MTKEKFEIKKPFIEYKNDGQSFDKNLKIKKAGIEYNLYDSIQANREDTDIYETLKKYGSIEPLQRTNQAMYGDFTTFKGLRNLQDQRIELEQLFENLPIETRREFDHNINNFIQNGEEYFTKKIKEETEKQKIQTQEKKEEKIEEKEPKYRDWETDRKSTRLNSSHRSLSRMPSSA